MWFLLKGMKTKLIACPYCGKETAYSPENPYRPFCSERCRLIDLGQWANESYRVPTNSSSPATDQAPSETDVENDDDENFDPDMPH